MTVDGCLSICALFNNRPSMGQRQGRKHTQHPHVRRALPEGFPSDMRCAGVHFPAAWQLITDILRTAAGLNTQEE